MLDKSHFYTSLFPSGCIVLDAKAGYYVSLKPSSKSPKSLTAKVIATNASAKNNTGFTYLISGTRLVENESRYQPINFVYNRTSTNVAIGVDMTPIPRRYANTFAIKDALHRIFNNSQEFIHNGRVWIRLDYIKDENTVVCGLVGDAGNSWFSRLKFFMSPKRMKIDLIQLAQEAVFCK